MSIAIGGITCNWMQFSYFQFETENGNFKGSILVIGNNPISSNSIRIEFLFLSDPWEGGTYFKICFGQKHEEHFNEIINAFDSNYFCMHFIFEFPFVLPGKKRIFPFQANGIFNIRYRLNNNKLFPYLVSPSKFN